MEDIFRQIAQEEARKVFSEMQQQPQTVSDKLPIKQAEKEFGVSAATLYRHINGGHVQLFKLGGKSYVSRSEMGNLFARVK